MRHGKHFRHWSERWKHRPAYKIVPDLPHAAPDADWHTTMVVLGTLCVLAAASVVIEHYVHVNADIVFGVSGATFGPSLTSFVRSFFA